MRNRSIFRVGGTILWCWLAMAPEALADSPAPYGFPPRGCFREGDPCDAWVNMTFEAGRCVKKMDSAQAPPQVECVALSRIEARAGPETRAAGAPDKPGKTEPGKRTKSCAVGSMSSHGDWLPLLLLGVFGLGRRALRRSPA